MPGPYIPGVTPGSVGVFPIRFPFQGVKADVFPNTVQFALVADDAFVVVSLPDGGAWGVADFVDAFGHGGFEGSDDGPQGSGGYIDVSRP